LEKTDNSSVETIEVYEKYSSIRSIDGAPKQNNPFQDKDDYGLQLDDYYNTAFDVLR
jgi:hypothetical protein